MIIQNTDITASIISNVIGLASSNIGYLCAKAKVGGRNGYAYSITENGGTENDGELIEGAVPYHNIYSKNSPSFWYLIDAGVSSPAVFNMKNKLNYSLDGVRYAYRYGGFRGYNHNAIKPSTEIQNEINMGYLNNLTDSFKIYINAGELNWEKMFIDAGMNLLTDPHFGIYSVTKGTTEINVANETETGSLALTNAQGIEGDYLVATINKNMLTSGINNVNVKIGIGNTSAKSNLFGLNMFSTNLNLIVKERPKFDAVPIIIFYNDYDAAILSYTISSCNLFPATDTVFDSELPPYTGVRYSISSNLHVINNSVSMSFYACKTYLDATNSSLQDAINDGTAVKLKNVATYTYQGTTPYNITMNDTLDYSSINDETIYIIAYVESYID